MGDPPRDSSHAEVLRSTTSWVGTPHWCQEPLPSPTPAPLLTAGILCWEGLWLSIGVGGKGALWMRPLRVAPWGVGALGVASWGVGALGVAPLGVGAGALGIPWLAIGGRLERGLWVRGPWVGRQGGLGPPRISRVGGRIAVPRHQETLFMGHGLRFCGLPLEDRERTVSPEVTGTSQGPLHLLPGNGTEGGGFVTFAPGLYGARAAGPGEAGGYRVAGRVASGGAPTGRP